MNICVHSVISIGVLRCIILTTYRLIPRIDNYDHNYRYTLYVDVQCTSMYSVRWTTVYVDVQCTLYGVRCTVYGVHNKYTTYTVHCTVYSVHSYLIYDIHIVCNVLCTVHSVHCTILRCTLDHMNSEPNRYTFVIIGHRLKHYLLLS